MLSFSNTLSIKKLFVALLICSATNGFTQIVVVEKFKKNNNIVTKSIDQKKLIKIVEKVFKSFKVQTGHGNNFLNKDEKKDLPKVSLKKQLTEDAKDYLESNEDTTSSLLENFFDQVRDELASMIESKRIAKIIISLK